MRLVHTFVFAVALVGLLAGASPILEGIKIDAPPMRLTRRQDGGVTGTAASVGLDAAATVLLHESLFQKLVASVLPGVIADAKKLSIPGEKEKHFSFDAIHLSEFNIGSFTIGFAAPNKVVVTLQGLVLVVPDTHFDVFTKILFIKASCGGEFNVAIGQAADKAPTTVTIEFDLTDTNGDLVISDGVASVQFGYLDVHNRFDSFVCRVGQDIIQLFIGSIDNLIRNLVEKEISPIATKAINAIFSKMAGKVRIPLAAQPVATADSIELSFNLLPDLEQKNKASPSALRRGGHNAAALQVKSAFPSRDIEVFITQPTVNSLLTHFFAIGQLNIHDVLPINTSIFEKLLPAAYDACPGCPIEITTDFQEAPWVVFENQDSTIGYRNLIAGMSAVQVNGTSLPLLEVSLNGTFIAVNWTVSGTTDNTVLFRLAVPVFTMSLYKSNIGNIDVALIGQLLNFIITDVAVPDFNKKFKGIAIPPIANVTVDQLEVSFTNQSADFGLDIIVPTL